MFQNTTRLLSLQNVRAKWTPFTTTTTKLREHHTFHKQNVHTRIMHISACAPIYAVYYLGLLSKNSSDQYKHARAYMYSFSFSLVIYFFEVITRGEAGGRERAGGREGEGGRREFGRGGTIPSLKHTPCFIGMFYLEQEL